MTRLIISFRLSRVVFFASVNGKRKFLEEIPYQRDFVYSDESDRLGRKYGYKFEGAENDYDDECKE